MIQETIQEIAKQLGAGATEIIPHYTEWFLAAAVAWILLGCLFIFVGFLLSHWLWNWTDEDNRDLARIIGGIVLAVCVLLGSIIVGAHIGDLVSPEGMAYHQLIKDIRGQ